MHQRSSASEIMTGISFLLFLHIVSAIALTAVFFLAKWLALYLIASITLGSLVLFSITQVVYAVPLALWFQKRRRFKAMKGVAIGAIITGLVNIGAMFYIIRLANLSV